MNREQLILLVQKILQAEGSEEEQDRMLVELKENVPHPEVSDLIYFPPDGRDLGPEEIVDMALSYRPIQL